MSLKFKFNHEGETFYEALDVTKQEVEDLINRFNSIVAKTKEEKGTKSKLVENISVELTSEELTFLLVGTN